MTTTLGVINEQHVLALTPDRVRFHAERPTWEKERLDAMRPRVEPGMVVYDIGAECGDFTALYASWCAPAHDHEVANVVIVEPQPIYWPQIRTHFDANQLGVPRFAFVGFAWRENSWPAYGPAFSRSEEARIGGSGLPEAWPPCSVGEIIPDFGFRHVAQQLDSTPALTIDALAVESGAWPDHVVIDVEGAEFDVVGGAWHVMTETHRARPWLWVSVHDATMGAWYGRTRGDLAVLAQSRGYVVVEVGSHGGEDFWLLEPVERRR